MISTPQKLLLAIGGCILVGCGSDANLPTAPNEWYTAYEGRETVELGSHVQICSYQGFTDMVILGCLPSLTEGSRKKIYSSFDEFDLRWGTSYTIEVDYWGSEYEIADGPQTIGVFANLIAETPDAIGEVYSFTNVSLPYVSFTYNFNEFLNYDFECGLSEGCEWLNPGVGNLDLTFQLGEGRKYILIEAEQSAPTAE